MFLSVFFGKNHSESLDNGPRKSSGGASAFDLGENTKEKELLTDREAAFSLSLWLTLSSLTAVAKLSKTFPPSTNRDRLSPFPSQLCGLNAGNNHRPADQEPWLRNSGKCWPHAAVNKTQKGQKERKLKAAEEPGEGLALARSQSSREQPDCV